MIQVWDKNKWKAARSEPQPIRRGRSKGKFRVFIYTANINHPEGLTRIKVGAEDLKNQDNLLKRPEQKSLF